MNRQYYCGCCGAEISLPDKPNFCPYCGDGRVASKAEVHAKEIVAEMKEMLPALECKQKEYTELLARFAQLKKVAKSYASRGLLDFDAIPKFAKSTVKDMRKGEQN